MTVRVSRRSQIEPFRVMDVMEAARKLEAAGRDIVHMEVGQPGTPAPCAAVERLATEMKRGDPLGYTVAMGLPALRHGVAELYGKRHGLDLDPARVVITPGSSGSFLLAFLALFDAGDKVALADPSYPAYRNILRALDLEVVRIEAGVETRYQPTVPDLEVAGAVDGLLLASPANPTGAMLDRQSLTALADWCRSQHVGLISDEIYHGLSYDQEAVSMLEVDDEAVVINSFAKYFSMTGWRVGWMVVPERLVRTVENLAQNFFICAPHASQVAALGALEATEELEGHRAVYSANRKRLIDALPKLGFSQIAPADGAFYIYATLPDGAEDSLAFCARLLEDAGVATTSGLDFDPIRGHRTIRFSFARTEAEIAEGVRRLTAFMGG